eukprot:6185903-Pleurochrysis_carterae.AAC.1
MGGAHTRFSVSLIFYSKLSFALVVSVVACAIAVEDQRWTLKYLVKSINSVSVPPVPLRIFLILPAALH